jgi:DNA-binding Xre family transcriptional regulator
MHLLVGDILKRKGLTAYALAKDSGGKISLPTAYRLARGEWKCLSSEVMDALCDVLEVSPGELFERSPRRRSR